MSPLLSLPLFVAGLCPDEAYDPARLVVTELVRALVQPTGLTVAPDGRVFWIELRGTLNVVHQDTGRVATCADLPVFAQQENGLLGVALAPDFAESSELYLLYSPVDYSGQRLSRFVLRGDELDLASETVLLEFEEQRRDCCHHAGSLEFDPDGLLYLSTGDNTHPGGDAEGFAPLDERPDRSPFDAQKSASNTQSLSGKILRIRPTRTGYEIPEGNLFQDPAEGRPEIYVMGCRNPWRIGLDPLTGYVYWGEVGPDAGADGERGPQGYDEVNQARGPGNFGWPYFVGANRAYRDVDFATGAIGPAFDPAAPVNDSPNNTGARVLPPAQPAWIHYPYGPSPEFPMLDGPGGRTACAGPVYRYDPDLASATKLPAQFDGVLFAYEWSRHWIQAVHLDADSNIERFERFLPDVDLRRPADLAFGPEGALYLLEFGTTWGVNEDARISRIDYVRGNRAPHAVATAEGNVGPTPLVVRLSSAGTFDPDGDLLTYAWRVPPDPRVLSVLPDPELSFRTPGVHHLELEVVDPAGARAVAAVPVVAGNARPVVRFERPTAGGFFAPGEPLDWLLAVSDAEDGDSADNPSAFVDGAQVEATHRFGPPGTGEDADSDPGLALMKRSDCFSCHATDRRVVGPAYVEVAARYRDDPGALDALCEHVRQGSTGVWGEVPMLPHMQHEPRDVRRMVEWVLRRDAGGDGAPEVQRGLRGILPGPERPGTLRLVARYQDGGGVDGVAPLSGDAVLHLRSLAFEAEHADDRGGTGLYDSVTASGGRYLGSIHSGHALRFQDVDLAGLDRVSLRVASDGAGGAIELRSDAVDGPLVARVEVVPNGAWETWFELVVPLTDPGGRHDLLVVFTHPRGDHDLMNLDRLLFLRPSDEPRPWVADGGQ